MFWWVTQRRSSVAWLESLGENEIRKLEVIMGKCKLSKFSVSERGVGGARGGE